MIKVNGFEISEKEFDMACAEKKYIFKKKFLERHEIEEIADVLIDAVLMLDVAKKENIQVDPADIENTISKMKNKFKSDEEFISALEKTGDSIDTVKERIEKNIKLRNFVKQKFFDSTHVSDEDLNKYYEQYPERFDKGEEIRASHILFSEADKDIALEIHELLLNGEDFDEHAKKHSHCPSGEGGGDLGYFDRGKMVPEFEQAAFETELNEISDLVQTQFGYHIIKVTDKRKGGKFELDEIKNQLRQSMISSIVNHKIKKYTGDLRDKAEIVIDKEIMSKKIPS
ncbi:MAG: peptidylprolyl isomerase [Candidatus Delongbacteria bacterium]|nr:peptidylprolyl isomerase [Candidatus Delongbacteria bacterium]MCG2760655.1 peptidylprolyl isomerase [Candidatus Delongbacteria bacterium]